MRRKMLVEVTYTPGQLFPGAENPTTKKEIREAEMSVIEYLEQTISYDWHENGNLKFKIVKNDTSRVQNCRTR